MKHRLAAVSVIALMAAAPAWAQTSATTPGTTTSSGQTDTSSPPAKPMKPSQMSGSSTMQQRQHSNAATDAQTRRLNEQELSRLQPKS
jgi:hypothetical protein